MKKVMKMMAVLMTASVVALYSCKDDDEPVPLDVTTLTANDIDLNGATSPTDVPVDAVITTKFSTDVDATTATDANILLTRDFDGSAVPKTIAVTGSTVTVTPTAHFFEGDHYKISFTAGLKSTGGKTLTLIERSFGTIGIGLGTAPQASAQVLYLQFSNGIVDLTGNATKASEKVAYTADRFGNANAAANFRGATANGNGDIVELSSNKFVSANMSLSVWFYINQADYVAPGNKPLLGIAGNNGYFIEIGDGDTNPNWLKVTTNHKVDPDPLAHVFATSWGDFGTTDAGGPVSDLTKTGWHQIAFTYNATTYTKTTYFDGVKIKELNLLDAANNEWNLKDMLVNDLTGVDAKLALGYFASKANTNPDWAIFADHTNVFKGYMDDLRIFNVSLSASDVTALYTAEKAN